MEINSITKKLLFNTIRVDTQLEDGSEGSGTAFVVSHAHARGAHTFIVTNRHLVEGVRRGGLVFTQKRNGQPVIRPALPAQHRGLSPRLVRAPGPRGGPRDHPDAAAGAGGARSGGRALLPRDRQPAGARCGDAARPRRAGGGAVRRVPERRVGPGQPDAHPAQRHDRDTDGAGFRGQAGVPHRRGGLPGVQRQPGVRLPARHPAPDPERAAASSCSRAWSPPCSSARRPTTWCRSRCRRTTARW